MRFGFNAELRAKPSKLRDFIKKFAGKPILVKLNGTFSFGVPSGRHPVIRSQYSDQRIIVEGNVRLERAAGKEWKCEVSGIPVPIILPWDIFPITDNQFRAVYRGSPEQTFTVWGGESVGRALKMLGGDLAEFQKLLREGRLRHREKILQRIKGSQK